MSDTQIDFLLNVIDGIEENNKILTSTNEELKERVNMLMRIVESLLHQKELIHLQDVIRKRMNE